MQFEELVQLLAYLNANNVSCLLSYNDRIDNKCFGRPLPSYLELTKLEINAGQLSQANLLRRVAVTYESLYLSPALVHKIDLKQILQNNAAGINPYPIRRRKSKLFRYTPVPMEAVATKSSFLVM